jgi:hypothetical protein
MFNAQCSTLETRPDKERGSVSLNGQCSRARSVLTVSIIIYLFSTFAIVAQVIKRAISFVPLTFFTFLLRVPFCVPLFCQPDILSTGYFCVILVSFLISHFFIIPHFYCHSDARRNPIKKQKRPSKKHLPTTTPGKEKQGCN